MTVFHFQYNNNETYQRFCDLVGRTPDVIQDYRSIPHLPIRLFKAHAIKSGPFVPEVIFESSSTTGQVPSSHAVRSLDWYYRVSELGFRHVYKRKPSEFQWLGLLPSYLERPNASLVYMVRSFIDQNNGGFFIDDFKGLEQRLLAARDSQEDVVLIGVSFALLAFAEQVQFDYSRLQVIETGGMKGRGRELTRVELHERLSTAFPNSVVCSEYGMTELLSQAWSLEGGLFYPSPTMRVSIRELSDPLSTAKAGVRGAINCIDLANIDSCAFIATDDAGLLYDDGTFEVSGRLDGSEQRGCNLMFGAL